MRISGRKPLLVAIVSLAVVAGLIFLFYPKSGERLDVSGRRVADCIKQGDAGCVRNFMDPNEIAVLGLDDSTLEHMVRFVSRKLASYQQDGAPVTHGQDEDGTLFYAQNLADDHGHRSGIGVNMSRVENGNVVTDISAQLLVAVLLTEWDWSTGPLPKGAAKARFFADSLEGMIPELEGAGFTRVATYDSLSNTYKRLSLQEFVKYLRDRAERG